MPCGSVSGGRTYSCSLGEAEGHPAGRHDVQPRARGEERGDVQRRVDDLLEVVEQQQHLTLTDVARHHLLCRGVTVERDTEHAGHRRQDEDRGPDLAEVHEVHAVREVVAQLSGDRGRNRVFPAPPGPVTVTRRAPTSVISSRQVVLLAVPPDERGRALRHVRRAPSAT